LPLARRPRPWVCIASIQWIQLYS